MDGQRTRRNCILFGSALVFILLLFGALCKRAALPNNRPRPGTDYVRLDTDGTGYYLPRGTNSYDNVVTMVTAHNFARDGFLRSNFIPNRKGAQISLGDRTGTQCESIERNPHPMVYMNAFGERVQAASLNNDCIYIHYPPLADWVFGAMAAAGFDQVFHYKILALSLNCTFLLLVYLWIRREVRESAALIALVLTATLPAFLRWADALYFHCFQYFFLAALVLSWQGYLRSRRWHLFVLTWLCYFCEALVSHQLTICSGILIVGMLSLETSLGRLTVWQRVRLLFVQAVAPIAAFSLHVGLCASLLGLAKTRSNLASTMTARMVQGSQFGGISGGMAQLLQWVADDLVSWKMVILGLLFIIFARKVLQAPTRRPLALLAVWMVGGVSFWVAFLGTTSEHFWMMYRQIMPFAILLIAFVADTLFASVESLRRRRAFGPVAFTLAQTSPPLRQRALGLGVPALVFLGCVFIGWVAYRNIQYVVGDLRWNSVSNRVVNLDNLVRSRLDVIHWREDNASRTEGLYTLPVSGLRVQEPPRWIMDFRMLGPGTSHYEIWWLQAQLLGTVRLLVDEAQAETVIDHCFLSLFDGETFQRMSNAAKITKETFVPTGNERTPSVPYSWLRFSLSAQQQTRAARLTCGGMKTMTLRQIEASSS